MRITPSGRVCLSALFVLLSCSDPSGPGAPTSISLVSGGGQSGPVATVLPLPVVVEVKDADSRPVRGVNVAWSVPGGNGSVSAVNTTTDGSGRAQVIWTLGTAAGENRLSAGVTGVAPASVIATAHAGAPAAMAILSGDAQSGIVSLALAEPLVLRVMDDHGNGVEGVTVTFAAGSGIITPATPTTAADGSAQGAWTLGPAAGEQTVQASVAALAGAALQFTASAATLDGVTPLENDVPVSNLGAAQGVDHYYRLTVPSNTARLAITTTGGTGDLDLFVRRNALPTYQDFDCVSGSPTTAESCIMYSPEAGEWFVLVNAYSEYSGAELRASYIIPGGIVLSVTGVPQGVNAAISISGPDNFVGGATGSMTLSGLVPGTYTINAANILAADVVHIPAPGSQQVIVAGGATTDASVAYAAGTGGFNLDITGLHITQVVQRTDGSVPLVAGRDGLLRVFARSNALNSETPEVRVRLYQTGTLIETRTIPAPTGAVPIASDEGVLTSTWNVLLPGSLIQPGLAVLADVDPTDAVPEADESDNAYPASGTPLPLDIRTVAPLQLRIVPVLQSANDSLGGVSAANQATFTTLAQALYPLPSIDADVREPYTFTGALPAAYDSVWSRLLNEILMLRLEDGSSHYYYGVIKPAYTSGGTGIAYLGLPAALGVDWAFDNWRSEALAHELGHNFGRRHVDCGNPPGIDPGYPHTEPPGQTGHHGFDLRTSTIRSKDTHHDIMSYCEPTWSSDYTYEAVLDFREAEQAAGTTAQPSLLIWGRIADDVVVLEPAFEAVTRPVVPSGAGRYTVTATDAAGRKVLDISFDGHEIGHLPGVRHFAFAIPLSSMGGYVPTEIRLTGGSVDAVRRQAPGAAGDDVRVTRDPGTDRVRLRWNAARSPVLMVRDGRTGEVLSFARGGDAQVATSAAEVEITSSDGVRSTMRRIAVPR